jgi:single-strand DNA-binding protein
MASVNKVILIGNLGKDPDLRYTPSGQAVATFSLATNERYKDKDGQNVERAEWHNIVVWGKQAEMAKEYLKKGRQIFVEGRISYRTYDDREGNKRYVTEVVAQRIQFLGRREDMPESAPAEVEVEQAAGGGGEDLPF